MHEPCSSPAEVSPRIRSVSFFTIAVRSACLLACSDDPATTAPQGTVSIKEFDMNSDGSVDGLAVMPMCIGSDYLGGTGLK
jgi:hypothetical protein